MLRIVGQITSKEEAYIVESITKNFVVGNKARFLAQKIKNT